MIFPPVPVADGDASLWYSVQVNLPPAAEAAVQTYVTEGEGLSWTVALHGALYGYRATLWTPEALRTELVGKIQEGMAGAATPVTPAFWEAIAGRAKANSTRTAALRAAGKLGNLLLPQELYAFIVSQVEDKHFATPTDVISAAMPYLRPDQTKSA